MTIYILREISFHILSLLKVKISEKLKGGMTEAEALKLLSENGKLIKRPFILTEKSGTVGFDETEWNKLL